MIETHIQTIAKRNGIKNANQLKDVLGCSPSVAARLWKDEAGLLARSTLDRFCKTFQCELSEVITFINEDKKSRKRTR